VQVGDHVEASTPVALSEMPGELRIVRAAQDLGIEGDDFVRSLRVEVGRSVDKGEILCEHTGFFGLFRSEVIAPVRGTIEFITPGTGHLGIRAPAKILTLEAYLKGTVVEIGAGHSVTVETVGAYVQGIFGVGGERWGTLEMLNVAPDKRLTVDDVPVECSGKVLVGGCCPSAETLSRAASLGAKGFVTGSIDDQALASYLGFELGVAVTGDEPISMSVIVTEGFGSLAIGERVLGILRPLQGRSCSLNGTTQVRAGAIRPELIVPSDGAESDRSRNTADLVVGARVRIIREPHFGAEGIVTEMPTATAIIPTGARCRVLKLALQPSADEVVVARANVELVNE
jgi:hypothetical protein